MMKHLAAEHSAATSTVVSGNTLSNLARLTLKLHAGLDTPAWLVYVWILVSASLCTLFSSSFSSVRHVGLGVSHVAIYSLGHSICKAAAVAFPVRPIHAPHWPGNIVLRFSRNVTLNARKNKSSLI